MERMKFQRETADLELALKRKYVLWVRWLLIIATSYLLYFSDRTDHFDGNEFGILAYIASNLVLAALPTHLFTRPWFYHIIVPADAALVTLAIYISQTASTDFYLIFFLVIIIAAIGRNLSYVVTGAAAVSVLYGWMMWETGLSPQLHAGQLLRLPFLNVVAIFIGYLVEQATAERARSERFLRENEELDRMAKRLREEIAERKEAEEALRDSEERYRLMFMNNPLPAWVFDLETLCFLAVNRAAVAHYGLSQEEFLAMTVKDIRPPEDVPFFLEIMAKAPEPYVSKAWRHRKKDGTVIEVETSACDLVFRGRRARLILANDITERKSLEEQLRQAQKMEAVGQLAGGVAHDFNNLLTGITSSTQLLLADMDKESPAAQAISYISELAGRAATLTRQLLAFSRRQTLQPVVLNINTLVENTSRMLQRLIGENINLQFFPAADLGNVRADPGQIEQVLINLVVNGRDAMPNGGKMMIETANAILDQEYAGRHIPAKAGSYVMLAVSDSGCGMDKATRERIFEPFFTTKEFGKGTGLGLSTVYGIIKQHEGYIWVYSELGRGTTFKIYLPRVNGVAKEILASATSELPAPSGSETILLVEDEEAVRGLLKQVLQRHGYTVLSSASPEEAKNVFADRNDEIALLLTDVVMPGHSGPELYQHLSVERPSLKVLYMSGYTDRSILHNGMLQPDMPFLQKPFRPNALACKVREVLDTQNRADENSLT